MPVSALAGTGHAVVTSLTCDTHPEFYPGTPIPSAPWLLRNTDSGDVQAMCPWCLEVFATEAARQLREMLDAEQPAATGPVPDPVSGDDTDEDQAVDGAAPAPPMIDAALPPPDGGDEPQGDATGTPPGALPAESVELGSS
jgi:hypothetical protein